MRASGLNTAAQLIALRVNTRGVIALMAVAAGKASADAGGVSRKRRRGFRPRYHALAYLLLSPWAIIGSSDPALAESLYGYTNRRGVVTFSSRKPTSGTFWEVKPRAPLRSSYARFYLSGRRGGVDWGPRPSKFDGLIKQTAASYNLEPALVKAVVHAESAFNPRARSHKGASGLMQLMPATARRFGVRNIFAPIENIVGGVRYLRWLFEYFNGNVIKVLAGYNAGEGAVEKYGGIPPYRETQQYVKRVLRLRDHYRCDYAGRKKC